MYFFKGWAIILDESRRQNLDGAYDGYWARKNKKAELRELKRNYRADKKVIKEKWKHD
jgi:hypothetical protein